MKQFKDLGIPSVEQGFLGDKIKIERILDREISVHKYSITDSKFKDKEKYKGNGKCLHMEIKLGEQNHVVFTGSGILMSTIDRIPKDSFPFSTKIIKQNDRYEFT